MSTPDYMPEPGAPRGSIPDPLEGNPYDLIAGEDYDDGSDE